MTWMFEIIYAKSIKKDLKRISLSNRLQIKKAIEGLRDFPNLPQIKQLNVHPIADYRLRVGNYRVLFDVDWENKKIYILKIGHRRDVY